MDIFFICEPLMNTQQIELFFANKKKEKEKDGLFKNQDP